MAARRPVRTDRLVLEPVSHRYDDELLAATVASREELLPWMPWAVRPTAETQQEFSADALEGWQNGTRYDFAILEDGNPIGVIGILMHDPTERIGEIHYWIRSDRTARGYATEAARRVVDFAFQDLQLNQVTLNAGAENHRSLRIAAKLGFQRTGELPEGMEGGEGFFPALAHVLRREDWQVGRGFASFEGS